MWANFVSSAAMFALFVLAVNDGEAIPAIFNISASVLGAYIFASLKGYL